jgi:hypothetical protein
MSGFRAPVIAVGVGVLVCVGCSSKDKIPPPIVESIEPNTQALGEEVRVEIRGKKFFPKVTRHLSGEPEFGLDDRFRAMLVEEVDVGDSAYELSAVEYGGDGRLSANVPGNIPEGVYSVVVVTPHELTGALPNAFEVITTDTSSDLDTGTGTETGGETDMITDGDTGSGGDTQTESSSGGGGETDTLDTGTSPGRKRLRLTFDNQEQAAALLNFPVLVVLTPERIDGYRDTGEEGADIRFYAADTARLLPHEIERWHTAGKSFIWVRVPRISGSSSTDHIWMVYGDPEAPQPLSTESVWIERYEAVYHLNDLDDATGTLGTAVAVDTVEIQNAVSTGLEFDGTGSHVLLGNELPLLQSTQQCTLSAWVRPELPPDSDEHQVVGVTINTDGTATGDSRAVLSLSGRNEGILGGRSTPTESLRRLWTASPIAQSGEWQLLAGVIDYSTGSMRLYVDGIERDAGNYDFQSPVTPPDPAYTASLGAQESVASGFFRGAIDEVRIADTARSADWLRAQYLTLSDMFITYGTPESYE